MNQNNYAMGGPGMMNSGHMGGMGMTPAPMGMPGMMNGPNHGYAQTPGYPQGPGYGVPAIPQMPPMGAVVNNPNQLADLGPKFGLKQMLMSMKGVYIKQKFELAEMISGCETKNKYYLYERSRKGKKRGKKLVKCKESSGCCARNFVSGDCRPFKMKCYNLHNKDIQCMKMVRECKLSVLCWNRPQMKVFYTENGREEYLGKVVDNFDCCNYSFSIVDQNHDKLYHIEASCCQCGILFHGCPCEKCEKAIFEVWNGDKSHKLPVPLMKMGKKDCTKNMLGDADNFSIPFPAKAIFRDRVLLIAVALMIDYRMFEEGQGANNQVGGGF